MNLRSAQDSDVSQIMALEREAFGIDGWSEESWASEVQNHFVVVSMRDVTCAGFTEEDGTSEGDCDGVIALSEVAGTAELLRIIVATPSRRHGLGRELIAHAIRWASQQGADEVFLEVESTNEAALGLYATCGFSPVSTRLGYYGKGKDAIVMCAALPAVASSDGERTYHA